MGNCQRSKSELSQSALQSYTLTETQKISRQLETTNTLLAGVLEELTTRRKELETLFQTDQDSYTYPQPSPGTARAGRYYRSDSDMS